jgi:hypothetical protein
MAYLYLSTNYTYLMKKIIAFTSLVLLCKFLVAQKFAVAADKNNILYIGIDNPLSIAVEGITCNEIFIKTYNGTISKYENCTYTFRGNKTGRADIILYKKINNKLKEIGRSVFRLKNIPAPSFYIAQYGKSFLYNDFNSKNKASKVVLAAQQYVRADLENFDFDIKFLIDSFTVKILSSDSSSVKTFLNAGNKIKQEVTEAFHNLKNDDIVLFTKIHAKYPDGLDVELTPLVLTIND